MISCRHVFISDARTGGARGATPIFVSSVNPIRTGEGRLSPPITNSTPKVFHLPASLFVGLTLDDSSKVTIHFQKSV